MELLAGRVAVITGAASGIGRGIAEAFADAGAKLLLADVNETRLAETAADLAGITEVITQTVDVRDPKRVEELAERAYGSFGAVHVLCNNAEQRLAEIQSVVAS